MQIKSFDKQSPSLALEQKMMTRRSLVAGIDEAGRGALAGPVVAVAVCLTRSFLNKKLPSILYQVRDSKKLSAKKRAEIFTAITSISEIEWGIGVVSEKTIDEINILESTKLAMIEALDNLPNQPDVIIIDGNFKIDKNIKQSSIVKADQKIMSVAIASILAKVTRDKIMIGYHSIYPGYHFDRHKGYGTRLHYQAISQYGSLPIHRHSFRLRGAWQKD